MATSIVSLVDILHAAVSRGDADRVRSLLENGAPVNARLRHRTTCLHWAASEDAHEIVETLCRAGADVNATAVDGCTPLHYAAREDAARAVRALLRHGADRTVVNDDGRRASEEIYDETDGGEGAECSRLLSSDGGVDVVRRASSVGGAADGADAASSTSGTSMRTASRGGGGGAASSSLGFGGGGDRGVDPLERAMEDMAALLHSEKKRGGGASGGGVQGAASGSAGAGAAATTASSGGGGGGGRELTARPYVPAADHAPPVARPPPAKSIRVKLQGDGTLSDVDYAAVRAAFVDRPTPSAAAARGEGRGWAEGYDRVPEAARTAWERRKVASSASGDGGVADVAE